MPLLKYVTCGFVCDPSSSSSTSIFKYRVVIIDMNMPLLFMKTKKELKFKFNTSVSIFISETGEWKKLRLSIADELGPCWDRTAVACIGIMYWKFFEMLRFLR